MGREVRGEDPGQSRRDAAGGEDLLSRLQERLAFALDAADVLAWDWDLRTDEIIAYPNAARVLGLPVGARLRTRGEFWELVHPEDRPRVERAAERALREGSLYDEEFRLVRPDGATRWVLDRGRVTGGLGDGPLRMSGVLKDITSRHRAEQALRESEERFRTSVENMLDAFGIYGAIRDAAGRIVDFRIEYVNDATCRTNGIPRERQIGRPLLELFPSLRPTGIFEQCCRVVDSGAPFVADSFPLSGEGERPARRYFDIRASKLGDGVAAAFRDVTWRVETEAALRRAEADHRELLENIPGIPYVVTADAPFHALHCTGQVERLLGIPIGECEARPGLWIERIAADDRSRVVQALERAARESEPFSLEYQIEARDGERLWVHDEARVVNDHRGRPLHLQGLIVDVTARKRADELERQLRAALEQRIEELEALIDLGPMGIAIVGSGSQTIRVNAAFRELLQIDSGEASLAGPSGQGPTYRVFRGARELSVDEFPLQRALLTRRPVAPEELDVLRPDGSRRTVLASARPLFDAAGEVRACINVAADITDQKRTEAALRESEERFRVTQELIPDAFTIMEPVRGPGGAVVDVVWRYVNPAALRLLRRPREALIGRRMTEVFPEGRPLAELFARSIETFAVGQHDEREISFESGDVSGWFRMVTVRLDDGLAVYFNDITARRQAEEMLRTADRRKDEFLATLAHELRNPLAPIRSVASVFKLKELQDPQLRTARDILDRQVRQISRLVDDLLDVSRITRGKIELRRERVAISAVVEQAVETSLPAIQAGRHELSFERGAEELWLDADPIRLAQVVANLLTNAARYTPPGGKIVVGAERSGCEAVLRVRDTGIGIPPEMLTRIFDMFTQVDPAPGQARGGLGIGLQIVKRLVELHGGRVEAASAGPGQGSEFTVRLPLGRGGDPRPGAKDAVVAPDPPGGHRVLVIDDNRDAADALAMWVELVGSDVRTAYTAGDGLALASEFRPDVVLLDIGLPDLSGYEVARLLRARPETSGAFLVATTGWGQPEDRRRSAEAGFDHHLVKPLDADDVVTLLGAPA